MGCLILLVSLTCSGLHLQSSASPQTGDAVQCSAVVQESGGWNHLAEVTVPRPEEAAQAAVLSSMGKQKFRYMFTLQYTNVVRLLAVVIIET